MNKPELARAALKSQVSRSCVELELGRDSMMRTVEDKEQEQ